MLKPIHSETDYKQALAEVSALIDANPAPGSDDCNRLEILAVMVETYERELVDMSIKPASPYKRIAIARRHVGPAEYEKMIEVIVQYADMSVVKAEVVAQAIVKSAQPRVGRRTGTGVWRAMALRKNKKTAVKQPVFKIAA